MKVNSFKDVEESLLKTRKAFNKTILPIKSVLDDVVGLYFNVLSLIGKIAKNTDSERYTLEVMAATFRRVIASIVLLESGLPQEAHIILRNALEFMLVGIDITYNDISLKEWKKTVNEDLKKDFYEDWYFKKSKMCKRIKVNKNNNYPELERKLTLGVKGFPGQGICKEWQIISNMSVHAHSQAQIRKLIDKSGNFQLFGRKKVEKYENDFKQYRIFIMNIVTILIGIPKYRDLIGRDKNLSMQANKFAKEYSRIQKEMGITKQMMEQQNL